MWLRQFTGRCCHKNIIHKGGRTPHDRDHNKLKTPYPRPRKLTNTSSSKQILCSCQFEILNHCNIDALMPFYYVIYFLIIIITWNIFLNMHRLHTKICIVLCHLRVIWLFLPQIEQQIYLHSTLPLPCRPVTGLDSFKWERGKWIFKDSLIPRKNFLYSFVTSYSRKHCTTGFPMPSTHSVSLNLTSLRSFRIWGQIKIPSFIPGWPEETS